jgi:hypothetical protein
MRMMMPAFRRGNDCVAVRVDTIQLAAGGSLTLANEVAAATDAGSVPVDSAPAVSTGALTSNGT